MEKIQTPSLLAGKSEVAEEELEEEFDSVFGDLPQSRPQQTPADNILDTGHKSSISAIKSIFDSTPGTNAGELHPTSISFEDEGDGTKEERNKSEASNAAQPTTAEGLGSEDGSNSLNAATSEEVVSNVTSPVAKTTISSSCNSSSSLSASKTTIPTQAAEGREISLDDVLHVGKSPKSLGMKVFRSNDIIWSPIKTSARSESKSAAASWASEQSEEHIEGDAIASAALRKHVATPLPNIGNIKHKYLVAAAKSLSSLYETDTCSYLIRPPYSSDEDDKKWLRRSVWTSTEYRENASVHEPSSLEITAYNDAGNVVVMLKGQPRLEVGGEGEEMVAWRDCTYLSDEKKGEGFTDSL